MQWMVDSFEGLTPVSTNRISVGFQKVTKFIDGTGSQPDLVADCSEEAGKRIRIITIQVCI